jgi:hypothetical protein
MDSTFIQLVKCLTYTKQELDQNYRATETITVTETKDETYPELF